MPVILRTVLIIKATRMKGFPHIILLALACVLTGAPALAMGSMTTKDSFIVKTLVYKHTPSGDLKLDLYLPQGDNKRPRPIIILFHGGGWTSGDRENMDWQCRYFAHQGLVAATADYRLLQRGAEGASGTKEICIQDVKSAIRWVKSHAATWQVDSGAVILGGGSAGGHLAVMATLDDSINDPNDDRRISTGCRALVLFNPAFSLQENAAWQPFRLITRKNVPPTIMFFGSEDRWKPAADTLYIQLLGQSDHAEMWVANGQRHAFFNHPPWKLSTCIRAQFFLNQLGLIDSPTVRVPAGGNLIKK